MSQFVISQIVALDSQDKSLYCQVIDIIKERQMCWARPIILVDLKNKDNDYLLSKNIVYDLRYTSDLLWKIDAFRLVLDTEYIEFLVNIKEFEFDEEKLLLAKQKLRLFIREILGK